MKIIPPSVKLIIEPRPWPALGATTFGGFAWVVIIAMHRSVLWARAPLISLPLFAMLACAFLRRKQLRPAPAQHAANGANRRLKAHPA